MGKVSCRGGDGDEMNERERLDESKEERDECVVIVVLENYGIKRDQMDSGLMPMTDKVQFRGAVQS